MNGTRQGDPLARALRRLKDEDQALSASPAVEARLLEQLRGLRKPQRRWWPHMIAALAAVAIVLATVSITWWKPVPQVPANAANVAQEVTTEFFPLFYGSVPAVQSHVVRLELPRASLARFGLTSADAIERTAGTVLADVLVGDDGLARAVRFVRILSQEERQ